MSDERTATLDRAAELAELYRTHRAVTGDRLAARNEAMCRAHDAGATLAEIAKAVGISLEAASKALGRPGRPEGDDWRARRTR